MGYYYAGNEGPPHKKRRRNGFIPILIGIILGAAIVYFGYPQWFDSKSIEGNTEKDGEEQQEKGYDTERITKDYIAFNIETQITKVVKQVSPSVVGITNIQDTDQSWEQQAEQNEAGTGSGVIYKKDDKYAYIITNQHVVEHADSLEVVFSDDTYLEAELVGSDLFTDLAVLRVDGEKVFTTIEMGVSAALNVGEPAIAIGNPLGHMFAGSVTQGIISGKQRTVPQDFNQDGRPDWQAEVLQTDAAINPGNSGGALINIEGQLIGINSMKISQDIAQGIGFAIPIDIAQPIIEELEEKGFVTRPYLGVELYSLDEVPKAEWENALHLPNNVDGGVYIWSVEPGSPASQADLKQLDVIVEYDGKAVKDILDLRRILYEENAIGDEVKISFYRNGNLKERTVILEEQK